MNTQVPETSPLVFKQSDATKSDMWQALQNTIDDVFSNKTIDLTDRATVDMDLPFNNRLNDDGDLINETEQHHDKG